MQVQVSTCVRVEATGQRRVVLPSSHPPCVLRQALLQGLEAHTVDQTGWPESTKDASFSTAPVLEYKGIPLHLAPYLGARN